jgi:hypothetical protein
MALAGIGLERRVNRRIVALRGARREDDLAGLGRPEHALEL